MRPDLALFFKARATLLGGVRPDDPDRLVRDIGRRIAELRAARGWTQEQFAERLGVTPGYLGRLERGRQSFTVHRLAWLARALHVRVVDLFVAPQSRQVRIGRPRRSPEA